MGGDFSVSLYIDKLVVIYKLVLF